MNEIIFHEEKWGGRQREERLMKQFRKVLEATSPYDLGCKGDRFTWSNRHLDSTFTNERLDCVLADNYWKQMFKHYEVETMVARSSDHKPLLLTVRLHNPFIRKKSSPISF